MDGVGIDFGTSNSLAAIHAGSGSTRLVPLEEDTPVMPTATYLDRDFHTQTGQDAISQYIEDNRGRTVELVPEVVGEASMLVGDAGPGSRSAPETASQKVYGPAVEDHGLPGRLFRGIKRLLGDPHTRRLMVFGKPYRLVALMTPVLLRMRQAIEHERVEMGMSRDIGSLRIGHPVHFEGRDTHRDATGLSRLEEACGYAGFKDLRFYPEPVAATLSWRRTAGADHRGTALTVDFGGGTLDLAVLRFDGDDARILSTAGEGLGGDFIDQLVFREFLFPLLGKGETWRRKGDERVIETLFPFEQYEDLLLNWTVGYTLNQNRYRAPVMDCMQMAGPSGHKFRRLFEMMTRNLGYLVFDEIRNAKARLSTVDQTRIDLPDLDIDVAVSRVAFEALIADVLARLDAAVQRALDGAGLSAGGIDVVVRTGGSSLIPAVRKVLDARFPGRVVEHDPFTSVGEGLAIAAAQGLEFRAP
ncbi:MAG: Hsp70 family protein [Pseudomonadota bacterium]|nr:Hsp70 family protein [Pseudomonadota bacterium]